MTRFHVNRLINSKVFLTDFVGPFLKITLILIKCSCKLLGLIDFLTPILQIEETQNAFCGLG